MGAVIHPGSEAQESKQVARIGTNRAHVCRYLISDTGVASGIVFFGQVLGAEKIVCGAVTLLGVYLARRQ